MSPACFATSRAASVANTRPPRRAAALASPRSIAWITVFGSTGVLKPIVVMLRASGLEELARARPVWLRHSILPWSEPVDVGGSDHLRLRGDPAGRPLACERAAQNVEDQVPSTLPELDWVALDSSGDPPAPDRIQG